MAKIDELKANVNKTRKQFLAAEKLKDEAEAALWKWQQECPHSSPVVKEFTLVNTMSKHFHCHDCDHVLIFSPNQDGYEDPSAYMQAGGGYYG